MSILDSGIVVDLIVTDVVMPGKVKCSDLAEWASAQARRIPVIYVSGYARDILSRDGVLRSHVMLLPKPYKAEALQQEIEHALRRAGR